MHIRAQDRVIYRIKEKKWIAEKNVQWTQSTNEITADHVSVIMDPKAPPSDHAIRSAHATGNVTIHMDQGAARCHALTYDKSKNTIVLQGNTTQNQNAVFTTHKNSISSAQFTIVLQPSSRQGPSSWRIDRIISDHPVRFTSPDTQFIGNTGVYHHIKSRALVKGNVRIMHNKNYIETDAVVIDTKKKCYVIQDGHVQSLVDIKTEKKDKL